MATRFPHDSLWQPRCTTCIYHIHNIRRLDWDTLLDPLTPQPRTPHKPIPIPLSPRPVQGMPAQLLALPDNSFGRLPRCQPLSLGDILAIRDRRFIPIYPTRRRKDCRRPRGINALRQSVGCETAKDDRVDRAQPADGEEADDDGGDHGHIHQDRITLPHAFVPQHGREGLDLVQELRVRKLLLRPRDGAVVEECRCIAVACENVPVDAVVAG